MENETNHNIHLQLAHDFVQFTGKHVFLTGKAGTGKTTFLHRLKELSPKRMIIVAPTGVAAINAGGVTIHSFFQISFGPKVPGYSADERQKIVRFSREKRNIIKSLDLLIIDEISMVRADLLDSIDEVLRRFRHNSQPFGGVQMLMIGDMQQLPPVVKNEEWNMLKEYYKTAFFFSSLALQKTNYITITLHHVYRQRDQRFLEILNKIRDKQVNQEVIDRLKERYKPGFKGGDENYIILTTHNAKAKNINDTKLNLLKGKKACFKAEIDGSFLEYNYPTEVNLKLKVGAQVMFVKNDPDAAKNFYNGKIGTITELMENEVLVDCPGDEHPILVAPLEWQNIKYAIDEQSKEIRETIEGTFFQIPLKLAWAITIHKSQGLTFDKVIIDSESAFAHGQVYVALSRCRSLDGLVLSTPFSPGSLKHDESIDGFNKFVRETQPDQQKLEASKEEFQHQLLTDLFNFKQLQYAVNRLYNILTENQRSLQPAIALPVKIMKDLVRTDVVDVSGKFEKLINHHLLENSNAEQNIDLQKRIRKAVTYFSDQIQNQILKKIDDFSIETDNKEVKKIVETAEGRLHEEAKYKLECLHSCREGFVVKNYLKERAKASLETPSKKRAGKKGKLPVSREINNPELNNLLKEWRNAKASELNLPHYMILPLKTMRALGNQVPSNLAELKMVHGFGKKKLDRFGNELLDLLNAFRENNEVIIPAGVKPIKFDKIPKTDTRKISLELWHAFKDIAKVAAERDYAVSTIEGHLAHFVGTGELPVTDFVDEEKSKSIAAFFNDNSGMTISEVKSQLGIAYSYSDLKFVKQHFIYQTKQTETTE